MKGIFAGRWLALVACWLALLSVRASATDIMPLDEVRPGMRGQAYTIFEGTKIEAFDVEVIGVLRNLLGPKQHIILARLIGPKVEKAGVVAGMSGSPVYINGKLVGALSLKFGAFTKEPIAGITPIEQMLAIEKESPELQPAAAALEGAQTAEAGAPPRYPLPAEAATAAGIAAGDQSPYLVPIETPLVFSGFHEEALRRFRDRFLALGVYPVQGGGGSGTPGPASPLEPGGAVAGVLISGDLSIAGTGTITYRDGNRLFAFGHPFFNFGRVNMPMAAAEVVHTLASDYFSFKMVNVSNEIVGTFSQDRMTAIVGTVGAKPEMIPVTLTLRSPGGEKSYFYRVFEHPKLTPLLMALTAFNGIYTTTQYSEGYTYRLRGRIELAGHTPVELNNMYTPTDFLFPDAAFVASALADTFGRLFNNPFEQARVEKIALDVDLLPERRQASIEQAWADRSEVHPGDTLTITAMLRPYRGPRFTQEITLQVPANTAKGDLRILVSDGETLNRLTRQFLFAFGQQRLTGLEQLILLLNRERRNDALYVTLTQTSPTLIVEDKILPSVPLSQLNVIDQRRVPGGSLLYWESTIAEASKPMNQVINGAQYVFVSVR